MIKALLIGCGNIGAGYDLEEPVKVWTHAKAYSIVNDIEFSIFDEDLAKASYVAKQYNAKLLQTINDSEYYEFDIVSITTPTKMHFHFLEKLLNLRIPVIICEKPVVSSSGQVTELETLYNDGVSKVLVNYIRRFQPGYLDAKNRLQQRIKNQSLKSIIIKYKRGFLNNASHGIDLLEFFFDTPNEFNKFQCIWSEFDAFDYDPTITGSCQFLDRPLSFIGVSSTSYSIFELELFFSRSKIVICHNGNEIRYYEESAGSLRENVDERQEGILDRYMIPVIEEAKALLYNRELEDNFMSSLRLNKKMLNIIESINT